VEDAEKAIANQRTKISDQEAELKNLWDSLTDIKAKVAEEEKNEQNSAYASVGGMGLSINKTSYDMYVDFYIAGDAKNVTIDGVKGIPGEKQVEVQGSDGKTKYYTVLSVEIAPTEYDSTFTVKDGNWPVGTYSLAEYGDKLKDFYGEDDKNTVFFNAMKDYCAAAKDYLASYKPTTTRYEKATSTDVKDYVGTSVEITDNARIAVSNFYKKTTGTGANATTSYVKESVDTSKYALGKMADITIKGNVKLSKYFEELAKTSNTKAKAVATALQAYDTAAADFIKETPAK
ncbi:MAG: hypothetical protein K2J36_08260, partial [Ruminococcus sp.]|nr:hypothetical protein [Ruminococcus sp.]